MSEKQKNRILLVEDDQDTRYALSLLFEMEGFEIDQASDGKEAYAKAARLRPDLIITDINMPNLSGLDLIELIKENSGLRQIPIVAVSAVDSKQLNQARELGAIAVYQKPIEYDSLIAFIARMLSRRNCARKRAIQNNHSQNNHAQNNHA